MPGDQLKQALHYKFQEKMGPNRCTENLVKPIENHHFHPSKKKNKPGNLTFIRNIAKTIGKTTIPARWDSTAGNDTQAGPGGTRRIRHDTMRKPLVKRTFSRAGAGETMRSP